MSELQSYSISRLNPLLLTFHTRHMRWSCVILKQTHPLQLWMRLETIEWIRNQCDWTIIFSYLWTIFGIYYIDYRLSMLDTNQPLMVAYMWSTTHLFQTIRFVIYWFHRIIYVPLIETQGQSIIYTITI